jgi:hypothetical protein
MFPELPWVAPGWRLAGRPFPHTRPPSSFSRHHPCLSLISFFLPSLPFLNLCNSTSHLESAMQHLLSPPLFLVAPPYSLLHSRSTHLFFTFRFSLVLHPWLLLVLMVLFPFSCIDSSLPHFCLLLVVVSTPLYVI